MLQIDDQNDQSDIMYDANNFRFAYVPVFHSIDHQSPNSWINICSVPLGGFYKSFTLVRNS